MKILLAIAMSLLLVACGGSGGGSTDPAPAVNDEPMADSSDDSAQNPEPNSPTESPGPTDPTQNPEPTPDPTPEPSSEMGSDSGPVSNLPSVAAIAIEPGQTQMIMAAGAPAPALEGEPLTTIESARLANNGWVAAWGAVDLSDEVIWKGQYGALAAVLQSGDTIEGFPANAPFESVLDASLLNDGSLWALVRLGGAGQNRSAIIKVSPDGVVTGQLRIGDLAQGSLGSAPVSDVTGLLGGGGKIFASLALGDTAIYLAELSDNGVQLITGSQFDLATLHAPTVANGCIVEFFDFLIGETAYSQSLALRAHLLPRSCIKTVFTVFVLMRTAALAPMWTEFRKLQACLVSVKTDQSTHSLTRSISIPTQIPGHCGPWILREHKS